MQESHQRHIESRDPLKEVLAGKHEDPSAPEPQAGEEEACPSFCAALKHVKDCSFNHAAFFFVLFNFVVMPLKCQDHLLKVFKLCLVLN